LNEELDQDKALGLGVVHTIHLALGSSEEVIRSRESNFVLESSRFDEVLIV